MRMNVIKSMNVRRECEEGVQHYADFYPLGCVAASMNKINRKDNRRVGYMCTCGTASSEVLRQKMKRKGPDLFEAISLCLFLGCSSTIRKCDKLSPKHSC